MRRLLACLCLWLLAVPAALANGPPCGSEAGPCEVEGGRYALVLPPGADPPVPALLWLHGWGGGLDGVMRNRSMQEVLSRRGYVLVAPEGVPRRPGGNRDWGVRDEGRHPRDDLAFLSAVLDDAARRGVDRARVLVAGFSRGASMVWDLACHAPATGRAYLAYSGAFWQPMPPACAAPVDLWHVHGWTDGVVPLEGRSVDGGRLTQGNAFRALDILRRTNGCASQPAVMAVPDDRLHWVRAWTRCGGGSLKLLLHPKGHAMPDRWLEDAIGWFERLQP